MNQLPLRIIDTKFFELSGCVPGSQSDLTGHQRSLLIRRWGRRNRCLDTTIRVVLTEEFLNIVRGMGEAAVAVKLDEIDAPVTLVDIGEERRVARHFDQVAVALHHHQEERVIKCGSEVRTLVMGILTHVDSPALARIAVEIVKAAARPPGAAVGMLIHDVDIGIPNTVDGRLVEPAPEHRHHDLNLWVLGLYRLSKHGVVVAIECGRMLIADLDILERKRFWMSALRSQRAPFTCNRPDGVLDGIKGLLHHRIDLVQWPVVFRVYRHPRKCNVESIRLQSLTELEIFVEAKAICGAVLPVTPHPGALRRLTKRLAPVGRHFKGETFDVAAAREAHKAWLEAGQVLREVWSEAIWLAIPGRGKERDPVKLERSGANKDEPELCFGIGGSGLDAPLYLTPCVPRRYCRVRHR